MLQLMDLRSTFLAGTTPLSHSLRPLPRPLSTMSTAASSTRDAIIHTPLLKNPVRICSKFHAIGNEASTSSTPRQEEEENTVTLFSANNSEKSEINYKRVNRNPSGASTISSGVRLENVTKSYKGVTVLKDISWEVRKGEKVGLVGVNGAGKTTQLRIISGLEEPDSGNVIRANSNMRIAFLSQESEVSLMRTVKEEFLSAFEEEMEVAERLEKVQKAMVESVDDLELMGRLLDEFDLLQKRAHAVDLDQVDVKISKLLPELGFSPEDKDRLVASFSGGWQMRISLGKILLQVSMIVTYAVVCSCYI